MTQINTCHTSVYIIIDEALIFNIVFSSDLDIWHYPFWNYNILRWFEILTFSLGNFEIFDIDIDIDNFDIWHSEFKYFDIWHWILFIRALNILLVMNAYCYLGLYLL